MKVLVNNYKMHLIEIKNLKEMLEDERTEGKLHDVRKMMKNLKLTAEQAMDVLEILLEERSRYMEKL